MIRGYPSFSKVLGAYVLLNVLLIVGADQWIV